MTDLFKLLNLFLLESDGNLRSIPWDYNLGQYT